MTPQQSSLHTLRDAMLGALGALMAALLFGAFWMLCQSQVDKAQERDAQVRADRVSDCQSDPHASTRCAELLAQGGTRR